MEKQILIRYSEIHLKGKNRGFFERLLVRNLEQSLKEFKGIKVEKIPGRFSVVGYHEKDEEIILEKAQKVFGIASLSPVVVVASNQYDILKMLKTIQIQTHTFKAEVNRADKTFPIQSPEFCKLAGAAILNTNPNKKVDIHTPQTIVEIDIRENKKTYISYQKISGSGGMPVRSAGTGLALLSGGIDSPVAAYLIAKRGMHVQFLHFHSYPYTSEQSKEKVKTLAKTAAAYTLSNQIYFISFTKVQEEIHKHCDGNYMIALMRRIMMRIAHKLCKHNGFQAIVTGESLGQVASQTIESMTMTNLCAGEMPILRPVVAFDKYEIIEIAKKIGSYQTSILPYEDCCTVFLPQNPVIRPKIENILKEERKLNIDQLIEECLKSLEVFNF